MRRYVAECDCGLVAVFDSRRDARNALRRHPCDVPAAPAEHAESFIDRYNEPCRRCDLLETTCARTGACCSDCTHGFGEPTRDVTCRECDGLFMVRSRGRSPLLCPCCRNMAEVAA